MKKMFLIALVAAPAFAASKPLITKTSGGGFMMPEYAGYERCELYSDKVVITHQYGMVQPTGIKTVEERKVTVEGDLAQVIEKARAEKIATKPNNLCDGPSTSISADSGQGEAVGLFSTGGCGSPQRERQGVFSSKLVSIIDVYCAKTFKFASGN